MFTWIISDTYQNQEPFIGVQRNEFSSFKNVINKMCLQINNI